MKLYLGVDTSNYTTSIGVIDYEGNVICDRRQLLKVEEGRCGLRQQDAFFQHVNNLPKLWEDCCSKIKVAGLSCDLIDGICVSAKPRNQAESYMPVFLAGLSFAKILKETLGARYFESDHQSGHFRSLSQGPLIKNEKNIGFHLSGGTCELIELQETYLSSGGSSDFGTLGTGDNGYIQRETSIIGGSKDISFGQLLDRIGVELTYLFPCGNKIDQLAFDSLLEKAVQLGCSFKFEEGKCLFEDEIAFNKLKLQLIKDNILPEIKVKDKWFNLSGIETACKKIWKAEILTSKQLALQLMTRVGEVIEQVCKQTDTKVLLMGGVSSSKFLRLWLSTANKAVFGEASLGTDNAIGMALTALDKCREMEKLWNISL